jgi:hypothetical protein
LSIWDSVALKRAFNGGEWRHEAGDGTLTRAGQSKG